MTWELHVQTADKNNLAIRAEKHLEEKRERWHSPLSQIRDKHLDMGSITHHERDHDGQAVADLVGGLDQDDRQADGHADHAPQEGGCPDQGKGARVDVAEAGKIGVPGTRGWGGES